MESENCIAYPRTVTQKLRAWESGLYSRQRFFRSNHFIEAWARKLALAYQYEGHEGCVNRLAWNETGTLLASGSDDRCINIWYYPETHRRHLRIETGHAMNIFGVQFLPNTGDRRLVTGAMDHQVLLHQLDRSPWQISSVDPASTQQSQSRLIHSGDGFNCGSWSYKCHRGRVKDVKVEPGNPNLFWSVSEDGTVRQYDTRVQIQQQNAPDSCNVLIQLKSRSAAVELKSMDVNKVRPTEVAVACGDHYVRVYDRRMLDLVRRNQEREIEAVLKLSPLHMILGHRKQGRGSSSSPRSHPTYVSFGNGGDKLVATYHGDHAYAFSTMQHEGSIHAEYLSPAQCLQREMYYSKARLRHRDLDSKDDIKHIDNDQLCASCSSDQRFATNGITTNGHVADQFLSEVSQRMKRLANGEVFNSNYSQAVRYIEQALQHSPGNRDLQLFLARTLLEREWRGDAASALHQCDHVLAHIPKHQEALLLRVRSLVCLKLFKVARQEMQFYDSLYENSAQFVAIRSNLLEQIEKGIRDQQMSNTWRNRTQRQRQQRQQSQQDQQNQNNQAQQQTQQEQPHSEGTDSQQQNNTGTQSQQEGNNVPGPTVETSDTAIVAVTEEQLEEVFLRQQQELLNQQDQNESDDNMEEEEEDDQDEEMPALHDDEDEEEEDDEMQHSNERIGAILDTEDMDQEYDYTDDQDFDSIDQDMNEESEIDRQMFRYYGSVQHANPNQPGPSHQTGSAQSQVGLWCSNELGQRFLQRYIGHCNIQTDIKEVTYLGSNDDLVAAGSDDGQIIIYDAVTGTPIKNLKADEDVANCIQCHPYEPVIATSGIENAVKLWSPKLHLSEANGRSEDSILMKIVQENQDRMKEGPRFLRNLNNHMLALLMEHPEFIDRMFHGVQRRGGEDVNSQDQGDDDQDMDDQQGAQQVACRMN